MSDLVLHVVGARPNSPEAAFETRAFHEREVPQLSLTSRYIVATLQPPSNVDDPVDAGELLKAGFASVARPDAIRRTPNLL